MDNSPSLNLSRISVMGQVEPVLCNAAAEMSDYFICFWRETAVMFLQTQEWPSGHFPVASPCPVGLFSCECIDGIMFLKCCFVLGLILKKLLHTGNSLKVLFYSLLRYIKHVVGTAFVFYAGEIMRQIIIIIRQTSLAIISA